MRLVRCKVDERRGELVFQGTWTPARLRRMRDQIAELFLGDKDLAPLVMGQEIIRGGVTDEKGRVALISHRPAPVDVNAGREYVWARISGDWTKVKCGPDDEHEPHQIRFYWPRFGGVRG